MNSEDSYDQYLDTRNLSCPLPLLKAKQCLNTLSIGQVLFVQTTDPGSWNDFASYAELSKHQLVSRKKLGNTFHFLLQKGE
ncbi:MAG TPA: sulfurtransferase TusA family protein [Marinospirillum sp.]|uniref:sulfurtransferase TusA family protein n=1 Tax=Marinospirillum sp. TaxID=2183934 RepID=UPI002B47D555|nr:sulfurtransferase TusA family protein [Marinospirillum sp.]HKM16489.1 sulfurtransferase TusA family protein [Marinospirillum sp.]